MCVCCVSLEIAASKQNSRAVSAPTPLPHPRAARLFPLPVCMQVHKVVNCIELLLEKFMAVMEVKASSMTRKGNFL